MPRGLPEDVAAVVSRNAISPYAHGNRDPNGEQQFTHQPTLELMENLPK